MYTFPVRFTTALLVLAFFGIAFIITGCDELNNDESQKLLQIGLITNNPNGMRNVQGFKDGMKALGHIEADNIHYLFADAPVQKANLEEAVKAMLEAGVDLIFTAGTPTGVVAHRVTAESKTPVVFGVIADPVAAGVMTDLNKPGGNMTGVKLSQNQERRLELLLEIAPSVRRIFIPYNPEDAAPASAVSQIDQIAAKLGVELIKNEARDDAGVTQILNNMPDEIDAIFLVPDSVVNRRLPDILAIALKRKIPVSGPSTAQVEEGALMTYGFVHHEVGVQAARIADQIIRGADPAELPVETAEFFLSINLITAGAIGMEISDTILQQANIIIR